MERIRQYRHGNHRQRPFFLLWLVLFLTPFCAHAKKGLTAVEANALRDKAVAEWKALLQQQYIAEWDSLCLHVEDRTMPLFMTSYGTMPEGGRSLYISLHGGGNVPDEFNNQQWKNQHYLYKPKEGVYIAPRAPYNDWDMHCKPLLDKFYERLIQLAVAFENVNPDRVFIMGYSAGGDGVWRMAPRMADAWAAASMMAGHPGDVHLENLRNTPFMIWCGEQDAAYDRNKLCAERGLQMDSLAEADGRGGYIHETHIVEGMGHWMNRVDTVAVEWMARHTRQPYPTRLVWRQEEVLRPAFSYVSVPADEMQRGKEVRIEREGNVINITHCDYEHLTLWFNDDMVNLDQPITVKRQGKRAFKGRLQRSADLIRQTMAERGDPRYVFSAKISL